jgi:hypothetical protein
MTGTGTKPTIRSVRYDAERQLLQVVVPGALYEFYGIPVAIVREFEAASSKEQYFDRNIRLKFSHRKFLQV